MRSPRRATGWLLNYLFVADQSRAAGLLALPVWLLAGAGVGWLAIRWRRERSRDQRIAESRLDGIEAASTATRSSASTPPASSRAQVEAEELYGYEAEEIVGRPLADLLGEDESDRLAEAILEGAAGRSQENTGAVKATTFLLAVTTIPVADPAQGMVVAQDVGEVGRLTRDLRNAEAVDRSLREHLPLNHLRPVGSRAARPRSEISPQIDRLVGYTADEWLADSGLFARLVHPDDRDEDPRRARLRGRRSRRRRPGCSARGRGVVWVREEAVAVLDGRAGPSPSKGYLLDVGERKAAGDQAKRASNRGGRDRRGSARPPAEDRVRRGGGLGAWPPRSTSARRLERLRCSRPAPLPSSASWTCSRRTAASPGSQWPVASLRRRRPGHLPTLTPQSAR